MKKVKNFVFLHLLLFMFSFCGVFSKLAAGYEFLSLKFCIFYIISIIILGIYAILWQQVLKRFSLTTAFFNRAVNVIWGMIWGLLVFHEKIKFNMIIGCILIMIGIWKVKKDE